NGGQEATMQEALELLIELTGFEPRFLRRLFGILMRYIEDKALWHTAKNEDEDTRMEHGLELRQKKKKRTSMIYGMCSIIPKSRRR
nr:hypothetical protein [Tanacetum cinerariifolium]